MVSERVSAKSDGGDVVGDGGEWGCGEKGGGETTTVVVGATVNVVVNLIADKSSDDDGAMP